MGSRETRQGRNTTLETVLPRVSELYVDRHNDEYLVLNPLGPWWFSGSKLHVDFVKLCDGERSLGEILGSLSVSHSGLSEERVIRVADALHEAQFFEPTGRQETRDLHIVFFNITQRCNLRCPYCYYDSTPMDNSSPAKELSAREWIGFAREVAKVNPRAKVMLSGGEPLLRPDAVDIIEGVAESSLEVKLITNATLLTEDLVTRLAEVDRFSVQVSIDSIDPKTNAKSRGKGSLKKALRAVHLLKEAGISFVISCTLTRLNNKTVRQFRDYCVANGFDFRSSIFMLSGEKSKKNAGWLELTPDEYLDASLYVLEDYDPNTTMGHPMIPGQRRYGCAMGYGQVDVGPDGAMYPCSHINDPEYCIGNITTTDLRRLIEKGHERYGGYEVENIRHCTTTKCPVRYFCGGGCRANSLHNSGILDVPPKNCEGLKQTYITALWVSVVGSSYLDERRS